MKHKHYDMIVAKAANMDLVVFCNGPFGSKWHVVDHKWPAVTEDFDYFLCLQHHKDVCLHWLNGGEAQTSWGRGKPRTEQVSQEFHDIISFQEHGGKWNVNSWYMKDDYHSRTKPRKEKRWIGVRASDGATTATHNTVQKARSDVAGLTGDWQFIEIEVDV